MSTRVHTSAPVPNILAHKISSSCMTMNLSITVRRLTYKPGILCSQILLPLKIPLQLDGIALTHHANPPGHPHPDQPHPSAPGRPAGGRCPSPCGAVAVWCRSAPRPTQQGQRGAGGRARVGAAVKWRG
mmetsp:Transcript_10572/g.30528  ORF Transcript_10572/g.30528 Transcript_10572/m.30528 type:complete len:129 (-) Transcript_10572:198-584(-)